MYQGTCKQQDVGVAESNHAAIISSVLLDKVPGFCVPPPDNRPVFEKMIELLFIKTNMMKLVIFG